MSAANRDRRARYLSPANSLLARQKFPCWPLPDFISKTLIENALLPMNREISEPESISSLLAGNSKKGRPKAPLFRDAEAAAQVSRLEKRTVVARAR
jgi:hypothetical protein